jgi:hypothetical protein
MKNNKMTELDIKNLQDVSGGYLGEVTEDSELLHKLGLIDAEVNDYDVMFHWESSSAKVHEGWAKVGITSVTVYDFFNKYFYQGKVISRKKAYEIARDAILKGPKIKQKAY